MAEILQESIVMLSQDAFVWQLQQRSDPKFSNMYSAAEVCIIQAGENMAKAEKMSSSFKEGTSFIIAGVYLQCLEEVPQQGWLTNRFLARLNQAFADTPLPQLTENHLFPHTTDEVQRRITIDQFDTAFTQTMQSHLKQTTDWNGLFSPISLMTPVHLVLNAYRDNLLDIPEPAIRQAALYILEIARNVERGILT